MYVCRGLSAGWYFRKYLAGPKLTNNFMLWSQYPKADRINSYRILNNVFNPFTELLTKSFSLIGG